MSDGLVTSSHKEKIQAHSPFQEPKSARVARASAHRQNRKWRIAPYLIIVHATLSSSGVPGAATPSAHPGHGDLRVQLSGTNAGVAPGGGDGRHRSGFMRLVVDGPAGRSSGDASRRSLVSLLVPEGADPMLEATLAAHGDNRILGPRGTFVGSVLLSIADYLPSARTEDFWYLAEGLHALLLGSLNASHAEPQTREAAKNDHLRSRVDEIIAANIHSARLDAQRIAKLAGVSRATLYRLFDGCGGVAAHIRRLRLERIRTDLCDPSHLTVPIALVAERNGLHNVASFNRSFRRIYGLTPREMRSASADLTSRNEGCPQ